MKIGKYIVSDSWTVDDTYGSIRLDIYSGESLQPNSRFNILNLNSIGIGVWLVVQPSIELFYLYDECGCTKFSSREDAINSVNDFLSRLQKLMSYL